MDTSGSEYYDLNELSNHLDINRDDDFSNKKKNRNFKLKFSTLADVDDFDGVSVGFRNQALFDNARIKAYKHRSLGESEYSFVKWCVDVVFELNAKNEIPLDDKECVTIGESIGYWSYANIEPNKKSAVDVYGEEGRAYSLVVRKAKAHKNKIKILKLHKNNSSLSNREISRELGFSTFTVNQAIKSLEKNIALKKQAAVVKKQINERKSGSVYFTSADGTISESFVNQVVKPEASPMGGGWQAIRGPS